MTAKSFRLPSVVRDALRRLAEEAEDCGVELTLFGSFVQGRGRSDSDIDLLFRARDAKARRWLFRRLETLPTIRPIDLVDAEEASAELLAEAARDGRSLGEWASSPAA